MNRRSFLSLVGAAHVVVIPPPGRYASGVADGERIDAEAMARELRRRAPNATFRAYRMSGPIPGEAGYVEPPRLLGMRLAFPE